MTASTTEILAKSINDLPFSREFKTILSLQKIETLSQLSSIHIAELQKINGFTFHILQEYIEFMQANDLQHLILQH